MPLIWTNAGIIDEVLARKSLRCAISTVSPYFGEIHGLKGPSGFDMDFCQAVGAALFGGLGNITYVDITITQRFSELRNRNEDLTIRTTTNSLGRDTIENVTFTIPNYHDGQGFMVPNDSPITSLAELDSPENTFCVTASTTSYSNAVSFMKYAQPVTAPDNLSRNKMYFAGNCTSLTTDVSGLISLKSLSDKILPGTISREPLSMLTWEVDPQWSSFVGWVIEGLLLAEYYGVHQSNIASVLVQPDLPIELQYLLGLQPLNLTLPIRPTFFQDVLLLVGDYSDIYNRQLEAVINRYHTFNSLFLQGGLYFPLRWAPPSTEYISPRPWEGPTVDRVRARGYLRCGCHLQSPIYGILQPIVSGARFADVHGFDGSMCKAVAAAIFASPAVGPAGLDLSAYVEFVDTTNRVPFEMLNTGEIDVLFKSITATIGRDLENAATFSLPYIYDFMAIGVHTADNYISSLQLNFPGITYCVGSGSTASQYAESQIPRATAMLFSSHDEAIAAFIDGDCDAVLGDHLLLIQYLVDSSKYYLILDQNTREPVAAVTNDYDPKFSEIVHWVRNGLVLAEYYGITQAGILALPDPRAATLPPYANLPAEGKRLLAIDMYNKTGLPLDILFMRYVIGAVGNYGEIYEKYIESYLPRAGSYNNLWSNSGLLFSPPWLGQSGPAVPVPAPSQSSFASTILFSFTSLLFFIIVSILF